MTAEHRWLLEQRDGRVFLEHTSVEGSDTHTEREWGGEGLVLTADLTLTLTFHLHGSDQVTIGHETVETNKLVQRLTDDLREARGRLAVVRAAVYEEEVGW